MNGLTRMPSVLARRHMSYCAYLIDLRVLTPLLFPFLRFQKARNSNTDRGTETFYQVLAAL